MNLDLILEDKSYRFTLYPLNTTFYRIAGIYAFLIIPYHGEPVEPQSEDQTPITLYHLLYLGITNNFQGRFNRHHKIQQAVALGMTHIGIFKISSGRKRKKTEREILKTCNPPLNQTWL